jgi:hypothetical protein
MDALMASEVGGLREATLAVWKGACEGLLAGVGADVSDEIGSLVELLGALRAVVSLGRVSLAGVGARLLRLRGCSSGSGCRV